MLRYFLVHLVFISLLFALEPVNAFPQAVAGFILGRPITESSVKKQMKGMDAFTDPLIKGTDAISILEFPVGEPEIELSVLVVEPRRYGIRVQEKIEIKKKEKTFNYSLSIKMDDEIESGTAKKIVEKITADAGGEKKNVEFTPKQISQILEEQARAGGSISTTGNPRTIFLLLGYGVPKKAGLPMALLLAKHGIRTVIPDLRGQGESGGKGVTWGKTSPAI